MARLPSAFIQYVRRRPGQALVRLGIVLLLALGGMVGLRELNFRHHLRSARTEIERGHNGPADRHLSACQAVHPRNSEVLLLSAAVARRSGFWEESEEFLDRYFREYGDDEALVFERLLLRATRGDLDSSAPLLIAKIEAGSPQVRWAREALVTGLVFRFRWIEAEHNLAGWLASSPDDTFALMLRGKLQEQRLQTSEALHTYQRVVERDAEHDEARLRLTTLLLQQRQGEEVLAHLDFLRKRMPDHPTVQVQWVQALALLGRTEESRAALDECLRRFPEFAPALAERGAIALQEGDDRAAEEYLGRAARLSPGDYVARNQYALVLARNGKAAEAAREQESLKQLKADQERFNHLVGALVLSPNDPAIPHEIGLIALRSGQPSEGLRWLQAALQVDPNHAPTHQILAGFYQNAGNPALAARHRALGKQLAGAKKP